MSAYLGAFSASYVRERLLFQCFQLDSLRQENYRAQVRYHAMHSQRGPCTNVRGLAGLTLACNRDSTLSIPSQTDRFALKPSVLILMPINTDFHQLLPDLTEPRFIAAKNLDAHAYADAFKKEAKPPWLSSINTDLEATVRRTVPWDHNWRSEDSNG